MYSSKSNIPIKVMGYNEKDGSLEENSYLIDFLLLIPHTTN